MWHNPPMSRRVAPSPLAENLNPAAQEIFEWILTSDLGPGDVIPVEQDLADRFDLARGTVREAIRELRALGILEVRRGKGTYLGRASASTIRPGLVYRSLKAGSGDPDGAPSGLIELASVRAMLECSLIGEVTGTLDGSTGQTLLELAARMDRPGGDPAADRQFHQLLYAGASNTLARELIDVFWDSFHLAQGRIPPVPVVSATRRDHEEIARCVMGDDPEASRRAMNHHFDAIRTRLSAS